MNELLTSRWLGDFLFGFGALFAIINPYGLAFIFLDRTAGLTEDERARVARRIAVYAFGVILVSLFVGNHVLRIFGISIPALRIAGGLVVAAAGWAMLHAATAAPGAHATSTADFTVIKRMAFFPMTIPLTAGPGTIATAIAIGANRPDDLDGLFYSSIVLLLIAICTTVAVYHAYSRSGALARLFGEEGTSVVTKLSAFLLLCIGVQIMITGVVEVARSVTGGSA
jgi:multiple antibiotic resistance protein